MLITWDPIALQLGALGVRWGSLLLVLGVAVGVAVAVREAGADAVSRGAILGAAAWAIPLGVVGARAQHVLGAWDDYFTRPSDVWRIPLGGLSLWGALVVGGLAAARSLRRDPTLRLRVADAVVPGLALGIAVGRLGNFVNGDVQGVPTSLPWATQYTSPASAVPDFGVPRHPAQLYDGLVALALFWGIRALPRGLPVGTRFWSFLALYGGARVAFGAVRLEAPFLFGLQADQLVALAVVVFSVLHLLRLGAARTRTTRRRPASRLSSA